MAASRSLRRPLGALLVASGVALGAAVAFAAPSGSPGAAAPDAAGAPGAPRLSRTTVPATGTHAVDVEIARFGRYAITAESAQGTAIQLVDRMAGPGEVRGEPGRANGRVDAFLEPGAWRVRAHSDPAGSGEARVAVRPFVEKNAPRPPLLPDLAATSTTLADLEQRSWWVQLDADEDFAVELAGRSLADVRLWRDGQWLDPAAATCEEVSPASGRPLTRCALTTRLGAGLWQLVAYGGTARPWADGAPDQPLHVRRGLPLLAEAGRLSGTIGPFGAERWLVPGKVTTVRLELPVATDAAVAIRPLDTTDPFRRDGTLGRIAKDSRAPYAELSTGSSSEGKVVTVTGAPGQAFTLEHFPRGAREIDIRGAGLHLLTTLHAGAPADRPDVTAILAEASSAATPVAASLLPLAKSSPYRRRFNLLGATTLWFDVGDEGTYHLAFGAPGVRWRWEPLLTSKPKGYEPPPFREGNGATDLTVGRWALTVVPDKGGVTELALRADPTAKLTPSPPRGAAQLLVNLDPQKRYRLTLAGEEGATVGHVLRALPADLDVALPLVLGPGEAMDIPVTTPAAGVLTAPGLELALDGGAFGGRVTTNAGEHRVALRNATADTVQTALGLTRADRRPDAPLPELPDTAVVTPPPLPVLAVGASRPLDLAANASATFALTVPAAGAYTVESTGLLATAGALRTRTRPVLASGAQNGVGRNFRVLTWLREGDYQVSVATQGASAGPLALRVAATPLRDGGSLGAGVPARVTLAAGEGIGYRVTVATAGEYVLRAFGLGGRLSMVRLEDADGWPVVTPGVPGDLRVRLDPGTYRLVVLPEPVEARRIVTFDAVPEPARRVGHGPFELALGTSARHVWWEPAEGAERAPDVWTFGLDADATVTIRVDAEMAGELVPVDGAGEVARIVPGRAWRGRLAAGAWRLALVNARRNSGVPYMVEVTTDELVAGVARDVDLPASIPVSGAGGLYELASFGVSDVAARLYTPDGALLATSDDRPDDWNFRLLVALPDAVHTLRLEPVGVASGRTRVTMRRVDEVEAAPLAIASPVEVTPGAGVARLALPPSTDGVLVVAARSAENVGLAIERREGDLWRTVAEASGPSARVTVRTSAGGAPLRVRVASLDGRALPVSVRADLVTPRVVTERALAAGVASPASPAGVAATIVRRDEPGPVAPATTLGLSWCPTPDAACVPVPDTLLPADPELWLVAAAPGRTANFRGFSSVLADTTARLALPGGASSPVQVSVGEGPVLVFAATEAGNPGITFAAAGASRTGGTDFAPGRAVAVALEEGMVPPPGGGRSAVSRDGRRSTRIARLFRADGIAEDAEIVVRRVAFAPPGEGTIAPAGPAGEAPKAGVASGTLPAGAAWRARFAPGAEVRLTLGAGVVAVLSRAGEPLDTVWAADGPRDLAVATSADAVTLLNPTAADAAYAVTVAPRAEAARVLKAGATPIESTGGKAGVTRLAATGGPGRVLYVRGATGRIVAADGRVTEVGPVGPPASVSGDARVELVHGAGAWVAWIGAAEGGAQALWGRDEPERPRRVATPARVALDGPVAAVEVAARPGALVVDAGQPVVVRVLAGETVRAVELAADGVFVLPVTTAEPLEVAVRALDGGALRGAARVEVVDATPLAEGVGAPVVLGPGAARAWRFDVPSDGPIGVGLTTPDAAVRARLYGPDGALVSEGVAAMPTVRAGTYVLVAALPADAPPTTVRPAVVGLTRPDTGPPAEVVRGYLVAAGLVPPDGPGEATE